MAINPEANHDDCLAIFNSVGIYVMVALHKDGTFTSKHDGVSKDYTPAF
jgi:hypothetical protein